MSDLSDDELKHIEDLIQAKTARLRVLELQIARQGHRADAEAVTEHADIKQEVAILQAQIGRAQQRVSVPARPYKGLETFGEADAALFFGRTQLVQDLLKKIERAPFLIVLGASGSGKSSAVLAGLLPRLRRGDVLGSEHWRYIIIKPGTDPLTALAKQVGQATLSGDDALLRAAERLLAGQPAAQLVLIVDQAEELWTLAPTSAEERERTWNQQQRPFLDMLQAAASAPDMPVRTILTMRADFLHRISESPALVSLYNSNSHLVSPMSDSELRDVIERPAAAQNYGFAPGLVERLVDQMRGQSGALPLLEHLLAELWIDRDDSRKLLTLPDAHGGIHAALAQHANKIFAREYRSAEKQRQLRAVLIRLVQPGDQIGNRIDTRRRMALADLAAGDLSPEQVRELLDPLVDERLLTLGHDQASDAATVEVAHEALIRSWPTLQGWVEVALEDLRFHIQLAHATKEWADNGEDEAFVWGGRRLATAEEWCERGRPNEREQRFLRASRTAADARAARELRNQQQIQARDLASKAQQCYEAQPLLGLRLAIEALLLAPTDDAPTRAALWQIVLPMAQHGRLLRLANDADRLYLAPEQGCFVINHLGASGELWRYDGMLLTMLSDTVANITFSADGMLMMVGYIGRQPSELRRADGTLVAAGVANITFSANGTLVLVNYMGLQPSELRRADDILVVGEITNVNFSADGKLMLVHYEGNRSCELRRTDGTLVTVLPRPVKKVDFSADSTLLLLSYQGRQPSELRRVDGILVTVLADAVRQVIFSPDCALLMVDYKGRRSSELRRADGILVAGNVTNVIFSADGTLLVVRYASSQPSELRRADGTLLKVLSGAVVNVDFSTDGRLLVMRYEGSQPSELWHTNGTLLKVLSGAVMNVDFRGDGTLLVVRYVGSQPGELRSANGTLVAGGIANVYFRAGGTLLIVRYEGRQPSELRRVDGTLVKVLAGIVTSVHFSVDGMLLLVGYEGHWPGELRRADGTLVKVLAGVVASMHFSVDGTLLLVNYVRNQPSELRRADWTLVAKLAGAVAGADFCADNTLLVLRYKGNQPGELRRVEDGMILASLPSRIAEITFLEEPHDSLFVISYTHGKQELWELTDLPRHLVDLEYGLEEDEEAIVTDPAGQRIIVRYTNGNVYLLDLE